MNHLSNTVDELRAKHAELVRYFLVPNELTNEISNIEQMITELTEVFYVEAKKDLA